MNRKVFAAVNGVITATGITGTALAAGPEVKTHKLADNVYSMDPLHYNSLVVIGDDGVLITDSVNPFRAGLLKEGIATLTDLPVSKIVMTHEHCDHLGGTNRFPGADVVAQENSEMFMDKDPPLVQHGFRKVERHCPIRHINDFTDPQVSTDRTQHISLKRRHACCQ